jgi:hypothetical protein
MTTRFALRATQPTSRMDPRGPAVPRGASEPGDLDGIHRDGRWSDEGRERMSGSWPE